MSTPIQGWPALPYDEWVDTRMTLHLVTQMIAKLRVALLPPAPRHLEAALSLDSRGITSGLLPMGDRSLQARLDLLAHELVLERSDGARAAVPLTPPRCVAEVWGEYAAALTALGVQRTPSPRPHADISTVDMDRDREHCSYDPAAAIRFFAVLTAVWNVLTEYRTRRITTTSLQFWSGAFDVSLERWREAEPEAAWDADVGSADGVGLEYVVSGFWPGDERFPEPAFYSFTDPAPAGYSGAEVEPAGAHWNEDLGEFLLRYDDVRSAPDPRATLLRFLGSTCEAGHSEWCEEDL